MIKPVESHVPFCSHHPANHSPLSYMKTLPRTAILSVVGAWSSVFPSPTGEIDKDSMPEYVLSTKMVSGYVLGSPFLFYPAIVVSSNLDSLCSSNQIYAVGSVSPPSAWHAIHLLYSPRLSGLFFSFHISEIMANLFLLDSVFGLGLSRFSNLAYMIPTQAVVRHLIKYLSKESMKL